MTSKDPDYARKRNWYLAHHAECLSRQQKWRKNRTPECVAKFRVYQLHWNRKYQEQLRRERPELYLWRHAKERATKKGLEFTIKVSDIVVPSVCRYLKIPLFFGALRADNTPSLDRIDSRFGYVPGNIEVISYRANTLKRDASFQELILMGKAAQKTVNTLKRKNKK